LWIPPANDQETEVPYRIEKRDAIEVYAGDTGLVVLRSEDDLQRSEAHIFVHPDDVDTLIEHLKSAKADALEMRSDPSFGRPEGA
jgi:hypothetical protein